MLNNILTNIADKTRVVSIGEAALYALLGFLIVFAGIAFLILVVWLVGKIMTAKDNKIVASKREDLSVPIENKKLDSEEEISEETIAVITAAIIAYYQQTNPKCGFTVKRIKRI